MKSFTEIKEAIDLINAALLGKIPGLKLSRQNAETLRTMGTALFWAALKPTTNHQKELAAKMDHFLAVARRLLDDDEGEQAHTE